jgi:hypothetical protein
MKKRKVTSDIPLALLRLPKWPPTEGLVKAWATEVSLNHNLLERTGRNTAMEGPNVLFCGEPRRRLLWHDAGGSSAATKG